MAFDVLVLNPTSPLAGYSFPRDFQALASRCVPDKSLLATYVDAHVPNFLNRVVTGANAAWFTESWRNRPSASGSSFESIASLCSEIFLPVFLPVPQA